MDASSNLDTFYNALNLMNHRLCEMCLP